MRQRSVRSDIVTDVERPWIEALDELGPVAVREMFLAAGVSASRAAALTFWLHDQGSKRRLVSDESARLYRRQLEQISPPAPKPPRLRAIPGYRELLTAPRAA